MYKNISIALSITLAVLVFAILARPSNEGYYQQEYRSEVLRRLEAQAERDGAYKLLKRCNVNPEGL